MYQISIEQHRIYYDLLSKVGNKGPYQRNAICLFMLISLIGGSSFFVTTYLFYQQPYICKGVQSPHCTQYVCNLSLSQRSHYETPSMMTTLGNQNSQYLCQYSSIALMMESIFLGAFVGLIMAVSFADWFGRKKYLFYSMLFAGLGVVLVMGVQNIWVRCMGLLLWGAGAQIYFTLAASYITEIVAEEERSGVYVKFLAAFALGAMANAVLFYMLKNWMLVLGLYYFLFNLVIAFVFYWYVQSPPIEIISKQTDPQNSYQAFMRIAARNGITDHGITLEEIALTHQMYHRQQLRRRKGKFFTLIDILRFPSVRSNFFRVSFTIFIIFFLLFAPTVLMQKLFPNIIISGLINGVSQFATIPFLHTLNTTVSRRKGLMAMFALTSLFTFVQYILDPSGCVNCSGQVVSVLMLAFFFGARFFTNICSNFYINTLNETFPAQIRPIAYCSVVGVGRLSSLVIPFVPVISQHLNLGYNVIFGVVGLLGIGGSYMLRETINVPPPEIIEELRDEKQMDLRRCLYEDKLED